ncbi:uncharacterized protein LOC121836997 [Ixodes scapularis]|uniref:uncharacterized protein LOC121836997 n=1 Tax=Ixodes scapularis TaxID=6945 RepID=UPI001C386B99|nr:uncharacterized protein LOC121836997 [Ixodes scapularis]
MPRLCAALNCKNRSLKNDNLLQKWLKVCPDNFTPAPHRVLCSRHFELQCFKDELYVKARLKEDAAPTVCSVKCGLHVKAVMCDGLGANVTMAELLGCHVHEISYEDTKTTFEHPTRPTEKVHFIFDASHALKLLHNLLGDKKVLHSAAYAIQWHFIKQLHQLQMFEGLRAANKLTQAHIEFCRQRMKVKLAAQTLSSSVAKALLFAKQLGLPEFSNCEVTCKFIQDTDRCFELPSSRSPVARTYKRPFNQANIQGSSQMIKGVGQNLMQLELSSANLQ